MNNEKAMKRDAELRTLMLRSLQLAVGNAPLGGLSAETLVDGVNQVVMSQKQIESHSHAVQLIREMEAAGYVEIQYGGRTQTGLLTLRHLPLVKITDKGLRYQRGELPADPMFGDDRID